jgi:hypothetical protein
MRSGYTDLRGEGVDETGIDWAGDFKLFRCRCHRSLMEQQPDEVRPNITSQCGRTRNLDVSVRDAEGLLI